MLLGRAVVAQRHVEKGEAGRVDIAVLHERYLQAVFTCVSCHTPDRSEAEDITAEVFAAALAALPKFRGDSGHYAWLLGIARRKLVDASRRRRHRRELLDADLTEDERESLGLLLATGIGELPEAAVQHDEARREMRKLLAGLPEAQREALMLQVVHDLSIREIAEVIGRSEAATNSLLQRARAAIYRHGRGYFLGDQS
jgi:RNA polymerase sigma factor (sigma-70 family)